MELPAECDPEEREQADEHVITTTSTMREAEMGLWLENAEAELKALG
jgi:hypothetical protein